MPWTALQADAHRFQRPPAPAPGGERPLTYRSALLEAQRQALEADPAVLVMGEGVDDPAGSFGTTLGLQEAFGPERVFDLPLAENGCTGFAVGAAIAGMRPVFVHLRVDFALMAMDQIVNHAAKWCYMFDGRQRVPLVIRCIVGRGWGSGAQHSQSLQGLFLQVPGLKVVMPASAFDAKGLLLAAIADPDPVIFMEHRWLYDQIEHVPAPMYTVPLGRGVVRRRGAHVTVAAVSLMVREALEAADILAGEGIEVDVLDMRSVKPLDEEILLESVRRTGRLVVADTGNRMGGWSAEVAARAAEMAFPALKAPPLRVGLPDVPTPASPVLEEAFYPDRDAIVEAVRRLVGSGRGS